MIELLLGKQPSTRNHKHLWRVQSRKSALSRILMVCTRPASVLVKLAKGFHAKVEIANAQAPEQFVSAKAIK